MPREKEGVTIDGWRCLGKEGLVQVLRIVTKNRSL
jgi:hypothetical protein